MPIVIMKTYLIQSFLVWFFLATLCPVQILSQCREDSLITYRLSVNTFWSQEAFPKHWPDTRPVAQWSKLYGVSHQNNLSLFQVGSLADKSLQQFAEFGKTDEYESKLNHSLVLSQFYAPPIKRGVGVSSTMFFVNQEHSKVSFVMKIHPSPDWFIGVDSLDLCHNGTWIENKTIVATPMDAGTDEGFTFTAPDYANEVPEPVYTINSTFPREPYSSFYYKNLTTLPTLAEFVITKEQEYVKEPKKNQNKTKPCPEVEAVAALQNITTLLFIPPTSESKSNDTLMGNSTRNNTPNINGTSVAQLQNIIENIERNNQSSETNRTSMETSSEFQVRKRRKRKNKKHMKSVVQMLKEIINNEQTNDSESKETGQDKVKKRSNDKDKGKKNKEKTSKEMGEKNENKDKEKQQTVSKQTKSKSKNKTSNAQGNKKRHERSKHKTQLDVQDS